MIRVLMQTKGLIFQLQIVNCSSSLLYMPIISFAHAPKTVILFFIPSGIIASWLSVLCFLRYWKGLKHNLKHTYVAKHDKFHALLFAFLIEKKSANLIFFYARQVVFSNET